MGGEQARGFDEVLAVFGPGPDGGRAVATAGPRPRRGHPAVVRDPVRTEPADFAEFLTLAVTGAAAKVGRSRSCWRAGRGREADYVRNMLHSTVGFEEAQLLEHRTEPVVLTVDVEAILWDLGIGELYDESLRELQRRECAIGVGCVVGDDGVIGPVDPGSAPLTPEEQARCGRTVGTGGFVRESG